MRKLRYFLFFILYLFFSPVGAQVSLLDRADSLYGVQQYKEALETAKQALPQCKGKEYEAD